MLWLSAAAVVVCVCSAQRDSGYDLFGEERGCLNVSDMTKCAMLPNEGPAVFEVRLQTRRESGGWSLERIWMMLGSVLLCTCLCG